jgi:hypothetical protein
MMVSVDSSCSAVFSGVVHQLECHIDLDRSCSLAWRTPSRVSIHHPLAPSLDPSSFFISRLIPLSPVSALPQPSPVLGAFVRRLLPGHSVALM